MFRQIPAPAVIRHFRIAIWETKIIRVSDTAASAQQQDLSRVPPPSNLDPFLHVTELMDRLMNHGINFLFSNSASSDQLVLCQYWGPEKLQNSPALKRTIAFKQANSAGSTPTALNLCNVSERVRTSDATWHPLPFGWVTARWSATENNGLPSSGRHHWTAFSRNSSLQLSSNSITCTNIKVQ